METLQEKIKRLRESKGMTQSEIAKKINVSRTAFVQVENGTTKHISLEMAIGIAKALDISFNELFEIPDNSEKLQNKIDELKLEIFNSDYTIARLQAEYKERNKIDKASMQYLRLQNYTIELFEVLDLDLFEKHHPQLLAQLNRVETYATESIYKFIANKEFEQLEQPENYLLPFIDIEKYKNSRLLNDLILAHAGSDNWTREQLIQRVLDAKKRVLDI